VIVVLMIVVMLVIVLVIAEPDFPGEPGLG
jgi:hypothetical protein